MDIDRVMKTHSNYHHYPYFHHLILVLLSPVHLIFIVTIHIQINYLLTPLSFNQPTLFSHRMTSQFPFHLHNNQHRTFSVLHQTFSLPTLIPIRPFRRLRSKTCIPHTIRTDVAPMNRLPSPLPRLHIPQLTLLHFIPSTRICMFTRTQHPSFSHGEFPRPGPLHDHFQFLSLLLAGLEFHLEHRELRESRKRSAPFPRLPCGRFAAARPLHISAHAVDVGVSAVGIDG